MIIWKQKQEQENKIIAHTGEKENRSPFSATEDTLYLLFKERERERERGDFLIPIPVWERDLIDHMCKLESRKEYTTEKEKKEPIKWLKSQSWRKSMHGIIIQFRAKQLALYIISLNSGYNYSHVDLIIYVIVQLVKRLNC